MNKRIILEIRNDREIIPVDEISFSGDSIFIKMPVFDSEFRCANFADSIRGVWINHSRKGKNILSFKAYSGYKQPPDFDSGHLNNIVKEHYEITFSPGTTDESKAVFLLNVNSHAANGTFLTETGDYRFLQGEYERPEFYLSCFDGAHAFLFKGKFFGVNKTNGVVFGFDSIKGDFYSGAHWHEPFEGKLNESFELRDPDSLTFLKPGFEKINFSFKNTEGKKVSLNDEKFRNKVIIIQIMGSWCPNCMDETRFLAGMYPGFRIKGGEIIALAFEKTKDAEKAKENVLRMKRRLGADYEFLLTGMTGKDEASAALPMLNSIISFPTTIYLDKKGRVREIYTGFNGPATGTYYDRWKKKTTLFLEKLLAE